MVDTVVTFQTSGQKLVKTKKDGSSVGYKQLQGNVLNAYLLKHRFP